MIIDSVKRMCRNTVFLFPRYNDNK